MTQMNPNPEKNEKSENMKNEINIQIRKEQRSKNREGAQMKSANLKRPAR
jgi:hypothetical protein